MPLGEVRAGMACEASSVVSGLEPVTFAAQVLGVEGGPRPSDALIILRFSGDPIAATGIGQGFSGSPVRCPDGAGVMRVVGAISQGIGQYDNLVAGATPIEAMLATPTFGDAPAAPPVGRPEPKTESTSSKARAKTATRSAVVSGPGPWGTGRTPLTLSGPRGPLASAFQAAATKAKYPLLIAPTARRAQAPAGGLKPGDAVAASVVTGDVSAGAIGTVTYVDGGRVWAFGHPFNGTGPSRLLMERAQISTVIGSPAIADQVTYKLGSPVGPVGTVGFDGAFAIGGVLGPLPGTVPTNVTVRSGSGKVLDYARASVVDERPVRGGSTGDLLALGSAANAGTALQRITSQPAVGGSARTCTTIHLKTGAVPLYQCVDSIVPRPTAEGGVETGAAEAVGSAVSNATSAERFLRLVEAVQVDVTMRPQADELEVLKVTAPRRLRAGRSATFRVTVVQGSTGDRRVIPVQVRMPLASAGERTGIVILSEAPTAPTSEASFEELFEDEVGGSAPRNLEALRALYTADGVSGLRAIAIPGMSGSDAQELLSGESEDSELTTSEYEALTKRAKLVYELPTYTATGSATATVRPGF